MSDDTFRLRQRSGREFLRSVAVLSAMALLMLVTRVSVVSAQQANYYAGKKFIVAFPDTMRDDVPWQLPQLPGVAQIIIFSNSTAHVSISRQSAVPINVTVTPTSSQTVQLDEFGIYLDSGLARAGTWTVTADSDVYLYCYFATPDGSEAFTPLPVDHWGTTYCAVTTRGDQLGHRVRDTSEEKLDYVPAPPEIIAIAAENRTTVRFHGVQDGTFPRDVVVMLDAGEAYTIESLPRTFGTSFENLAGTLVTADKPIGVMSGNTRSSGAGTLGSYVLTGNTLKNTLIEWLAPVELHGTTFSTSSLRNAPGGVSEELPQVITVASSTGVTDIQMGYPPMPTPGDHLQLTLGGSHPWQMAPYEDPTGPNAYDYPSNAPSESFLVPGTVYDTVGHEDHKTWPTAMAELVPYERWGKSARFAAPAVPTFLSNRVMIVGDTDAVILLDGAPVTLTDPMLPYSRFRHALLPVSPGDHSIVATAGKFAAVAYGSASGVERYRPPKPEKDGSSLAHPTVYTELAGYAYAYPVSAMVDTSIDRSHDLLFSSTDGCDSLLVVVSSVGGPGSMPTIRIGVGADNDNVALRIDTLTTGGEIDRYRIRMTPSDRSADGHMTVTIEDDKGKGRSFIFNYRASHLTWTPDPLTFTGVPAGAPFPIIVTLTNPNSYPVRVSNGQLADGSHGFQIKSPSPFPVEIPPGGTVMVDLRFIRSDYDQLFTDDLILQLDCRQDTLELAARTEAASASAPRITGHSWGDRWLSTLDPCTQSGVSAYDSLIWADNAGSVDVAVVSIDLIGADADAGIFLLDRSDPATTIETGEVLPHGDPIAGRRFQRVLFRPKGEQAYSCSVRLIVSSGAGLDTVWSVLEGRGIESHLELSDYTFPTVEFKGSSGTEVLGTIDLTARPTRPITIRALTIGGAQAASFRVDQADLNMLPRTLVPGEIWHVGIWHRPQAPGIEEAMLVATSDGSRCDDSSGALRGESYLVTVEISDTTFGTIVPCSTIPHPVRFRNRGSAPLTISAIDVEPQDLFDLTHDALPLVIQPGEEITVLVTLKQRYAGPFSGRVLFRVDELSDLQTAAITGAIDIPLVTASIGIGYRALPGNVVEMPVRIDALFNAVPGLEISALRFDISYDIGMLLLEVGRDPASMLAGTLLNGWSCTVETNRPGHFVALVESNGHPPLATSGDVLDLRFRTFLGDTLESEIVPKLTSVDGACMPILPIPGHITLDSVCGLSYRLIEMTAGKTALGTLRPNPAGSSVTIPFSVAFDGPVRISLADGTGRIAAIPVDRPLTAGNYSVELSLRDLPSGLYFCRLEAAGATLIAPLLHLH